MSAREDLRLLLIQIRNPGDPMRAHEHRCFAETAELTLDQIVPVDAVSEEFRRVEVDDYDALLVGGSGEYSWASPAAPFFTPMRQLLERLMGRDYPVFASCFGFHAIAVALGGEVVTDDQTMEVGSFELELTDGGRRDPVFATLPDRFDAQMGHKDRLARVPEGVEILARGDRITCQAFHVTGRRTWATQFHPELTGETNRERYLHYFQYYPGEDPDPAVLQSFRPSPGASALVARFVDEVLLG